MDIFTKNQITEISPRERFISNARNGIINWKYWIISILFVFLIWQGLGFIPSLLACLFLNNYDINGFNCNTENFIISGPSHIPNFILAFIPFVLAFVTLFILVTRFHKKPFITVVTGRTFFDMKRMFFAMSIVAIFSIIALGIQLSGEPSEVDSLTFNSPGVEFFLLAIIAFILVPIQVGIEEIFFRGYILQGLSLLSKSKVFLIISTSCLFSFLHIANPEPWEYGIFPYLSSVLILAVFMSMIAIFDGGLELAIGYHIMNNLWAFLIINLETSVIPTPSLFTVHIPEFNLSNLILPSMLQFLIFGFIFAWKYKWFYNK